MEIENGNKLIAEFMGVNPSAIYVSTGKQDINGIDIKEGSIINADGYKSHPLEGHFHCVEYDKELGCFGSDIYGDFDHLNTYKKIEVVGHASEYKNLQEWEGNLGAVLKPDMSLNYQSSWDFIHPVYRKTIQIGLFMMTNGFDKLWLEKSKEIDHAMLNEDNPSRAANLITQLIQWYNENKSLNPPFSKQGDK